MIQTSTKRYLHRLHVEDVVPDLFLTPLRRLIGQLAVNIKQRQAAPVPRCQAARRQRQAAPVPRCQAALTACPVLRLFLRPLSPPINSAHPLLLLRALDAHILAGKALQLFVAVWKSRLLLTPTGVMTSSGEPSPRSIPLRHCPVVSPLLRLTHLFQSVATGPHAATKTSVTACSPSWTMTISLLSCLVPSHLLPPLVPRGPFQRPLVLPVPTCGPRRVSRRTSLGTLG